VGLPQATLYLLQLGLPKEDTKQYEALLYARFTLAKTDVYALATGLLQ
jgi:hypothetical protein